MPPCAVSAAGSQLTSQLEELARLRSQRDAQENTVHQLRASLATQGEELTPALFFQRRTRSWAASAVFPGAGRGAGPPAAVLRAQDEELYRTRLSLQAQDEELGRLGQMSNCWPSSWRSSGTTCRRG